MPETKQRTAVIGGAGVAGMSLAYQLQRTGWQVTVIEANTAGSGTSRAAFGNLEPYSGGGPHNPITRKFVLTSLRDWAQWHDDVSRDARMPIEMVHKGTLELAFNQSEMLKLEKTVGEVKAEGIEFNARMLDRDALLALEPNVNPKAIGGLHFVDEAYVDTHVLLEALRKAGERRGVRFIEHDLVKGIIREGDEVVGVDTARGKVLADVTVLAEGSGVNHIAGVPHVRMQGIMGEAIEVRGPPGYVSRSIQYGDSFMTPRENGRIFLGATYRETERSPLERYRDRIDPNVAKELLNLNAVAVPGVRDFQVTREWSGIRDKTTIDQQPVVGRWQFSGLFISTGFYGLGITESPATAIALANLIETRSWGMIPPTIRSDRAGL